MSEGTTHIAKPNRGEVPFIKYDIKKSYLD